MKLEDGVSEYEGRVELCYENKWYTVCDDGINDKAAEVVCLQLGLPLHGEWSFSNSACMVTTFR